ncbi:hypothetical protein CEP48_01755 [Mergibacter septicus]|uniref:Uncharacterized protein n=1 Tax=Mergibacter septicus TaxID=221402 RepID=A0A8E3MFI1_9PAST|nr:STAS domain-containing protein [Mergibacter septicus]AWX14969.1 hypothetical protein CEP47_01755 [Mergibacter septicus]QDJ14221.1 hypothetical protein CEP48_01755 [Mergibacter septicus]UTU48333.1 STAS domain-containing protein [Mergibacter septicus]WMR96041.1 hypothetical protein RDJ12_00265 [Mergibacter septicus]
MVALQWEIESAETQNQINLKGDLTRFTLFPLWQQRQQILATLQANSKIIWNLIGIQQIDSAGFAFLCELLVASAKTGASVKITQVPNQCEMLADLFDLTELFQTFR